MHGREFSRVRHNSDSIIVGRDPEVSIMRPAQIAKTVACVIGLFNVFYGEQCKARHASGRILPDEATWVEPVFFPKVGRTART